MVVIGCTGSCQNDNPHWSQWRKVNQNDISMSLIVQKVYNKNCNKIHKDDPRKFWNTMKPFVNDKSKGNDECQMLNINGTVCNDSDIIAEEFNSYFSNVVMNICKEKPLEHDDCLEDIFSQHESHESVSRIKAKNFPQNSFDFNEVSEDHIFKLLKSLNGTKSTGYDKIPASLIKTAAEELSLPTMNLVNQTIRNTKFPTVMKLSEISPIFKTSDALETGNYRPINILPCLSKIFQRLYHEQLYEFFSSILSAFLAAFRRNYMDAIMCWQNSSTIV